MRTIGFVLDNWEQSERNVFSIARLADRDLPHPRNLELHWNGDN